MGAGEPDDKEKDRGPKAKGFSIFQMVIRPNAQPNTLNFQGLI